MKDREKGGSDHKFEKEVTTDRLRDLLGDITYHWCTDQWAMRKTERTLLKLIGQFGRRTVREMERATRAGTDDRPSAKSRGHRVSRK